MILLRLLLLYAVLAVAFALLVLLAAFVLGLLEMAAREVWGLIREYRRINRSGGGR